MVRRIALTSILFALAVFATERDWNWADQTLPIARDGVATVPLFNLWTMWWNSEQSFHCQPQYWDAPIFSPTPGAFAFSEPQPATAIMAPLFWLGTAPEVAYKMYLWLSLTLNGLFAFRLFREIRISPWIAFSGSVLILLLPLVHQQLDVLQLVPLWSILWTWTAVLKAVNSGRWWPAFEAGFAWGFGFWMSLHHSLFHSLLLIPAVLSLLIFRRTERFRLLGQIAAATAVGLAVAMPVAWPVSRILNKHHFERSSRTVKVLSAQPKDFLNAPQAWYEVGAKSNTNESRFQLCPGYLKMGLAVLGIGVLFARRRRRRFHGFVGCIGLLSIVLAFGTSDTLAGWSLWAVVSEWVPGCSHVRNVFRFAYFTQLVVIILAVSSLQTASSLIRLKCRKTPRLRCVGVCCVGVLFAAMALETFPSPSKSIGLPTIARNQDWLDYLQRKTSKQTTVCCLPLPVGDEAMAYLPETRWMYLGMFHGRPLANGYSGYIPQVYNQLRRTTDRGRPTLATLEFLANRGDTVLVTHRQEIPTESILKLNTEAIRVRLAFESEFGVDVYRIEKTGKPRE